jgi:hypothetical protein
MGFHWSMMEHKFGKMSEIWAYLAFTFCEKPEQQVEWFATHQFGSASAE